jgi:hypothetical protein
MSNITVSKAVFEEMLHETGRSIVGYDRGIPIIERDFTRDPQQRIASLEARLAEAKLRINNLTDQRAIMRSFGRSSSAIPADVLVDKAVSLGDSAKTQDDYVRQIEAQLAAISAVKTQDDYVRQQIVGEFKARNDNLSPEDQAAVEALLDWHPDEAEK